MVDRFADEAEAVPPLEAEYIDQFHQAVDEPRFDLTRAPYLIPSDRAGCILLQLASVMLNTMTCCCMPDSYRVA